MENFVTDQNKTDANNLANAWLDKSKPAPECTGPLLKRWELLVKSIEHCGHQIAHLSEAKLKAQGGLETLADTLREYAMIELKKAEESNKLYTELENIK